MQENVRILCRLRVCSFATLNEHSSTSREQWPYLEGIAFSSETVVFSTTGFSEVDDVEGFDSDAAFSPAGTVLLASGADAVGFAGASTRTAVSLLSFSLFLPAPVLKTPHESRVKHSASENTDPTLVLLNLLPRVH